MVYCAFFAAMQKRETLLSASDRVRRASVVCSARSVLLRLCRLLACLTAELVRIWHCGVGCIVRILSSTVASAGSTSMLQRTPAKSAQPKLVRTHAIRRSRGIRVPTIHVSGRCICAWHAFGDQRSVGSCALHAGQTLDGSVSNAGAEMHKTR